MTAAHPASGTHINTLALSLRPSEIEASLVVKGVFGGVGAREVGPLAGWLGSVVVSWSGPGCDLSEEPAVQDARPVTLETESFLGVLPGPLERQLRSCRASSVRCR